MSVIRPSPFMGSWMINSHPPLFFSSLLPKPKIRSSFYINNFLAHHHPRRQLATTIQFGKVVSFGGKSKYLGEIYQSQHSISLNIIYTYCISCTGIKGKERRKQNIKNNKHISWQKKPKGPVNLKAVVE